MKLKTAVLFFIIIFSSRALLAGEKLDSVLNLLDKAIADHESYNEIKRKRIGILEDRALHYGEFTPERYNINSELYLEYKPYKCDSAIGYLHRNLDIAGKIGDDRRVCETSITLIYLLSSVGMYKEAGDMLDELDRKKIPPSLLPGYYDACDHLYGELAFYSRDPVASIRYRSMANSYKDSVYMVLPDNSPKILFMEEIRLRDAGEYEKSLELSDQRLEKIQPMTPEYAMATFHRAVTMRNMGDMEGYKYYLALSATSDVMSAIKDHASLWMLAEQLYDEGDIGRAYDYIRFSWDETVFYNARLRSIQSSMILSLIDKTYQATIEKQNRALRTNLLLISVLSLALIIAVFYIYRQMKRISTARRDLQHANGQLTALNGELMKINDELQSTNMALSESNQIKEEYIGRFIKLCSTYVDKLDSYRRMVNKRITAGQTADLLRVTRSPEMLDEVLAELYGNFDTAFLRLFPDFVDRLNDLLRPEECIVLKKGELLNTELRIFALIRLGIDDSSQIAEFLRYSVNTIYNYRAKVKNKAKVLRDDFETLVKKIR